MSIYNHGKFLRDDPDLCANMDGGHRRRNSKKIPPPDIQVDIATAGGGVEQLGNMIHMPNQQVHHPQQQLMIMQEMQQMQSIRQNMLMHQMLQQQNMIAHQLNFQGGCQQQEGSDSNTAIVDLSELNTLGQASESTEPIALSGNQGQTTDHTSFEGMCGTSLGMMPYLPVSRRDLRHSTGELSTFSNNPFHGSVNIDEGRISSDMANQIYDTRSEQNGGVGRTRDYLRQSQAKLAILEDMIALEQRKQLLLSNMDTSTANSLNDEDHIG